MSDEKLQTTPEEESSWPIKVVGFDECDPVFANDVSVLVDEFSLQLVFTRFLPPVLRQRVDAQEIDERGYLLEPVVARIIVPPPVGLQLSALIEQRVKSQAKAMEQRIRRLEDRSIEQNDQGGNTDE